MIIYPFPGYALIGKMVVMKVTMKNPPAFLSAYRFGRERISLSFRSYAFTTVVECFPNLNFVDFAFWGKILQILYRDLRIHAH
jgi:hypothetical protein